MKETKAKEARSLYFHLCRILGNAKQSIVIGSRPLVASEKSGEMDKRENIKDQYGGIRKLFGVMVMFIALIVVMVLLVYKYVKIQ